MEAVIVDVDNKMLNCPVASDGDSPCPFTKVGNFFRKSPKIRFDFVV